jgi:hypothetical protein
MSEGGEVTGILGKLKKEEAVGRDLERYLVSLDQSDEKGCRLFLHNNFLGGGRDEKNRISRGCFLLAVDTCIILFFEFFCQ